jgi:PKD domain-containing protein
MADDRCRTVSKRWPRLLALLGVALGTALVLAFPACNDNPSGPDLSATCSATPTAGTAPLVVTFTLNVAGTSTFDVSINYGDGRTSSTLNLAHIYQNAGAYTASFSVSAGGRSANCSTAVNVTGGPPAPTPTPPAPTPTPSTGVNQAPTPVYRTTPKPGAGDVFTGTAPFAIEFSMCASSDVDKDVLLWTMDFEGDGKTEVHGSTGGSCRRSNSYAAGNYRPEICVTDLDAAGKARHDFQCKRYTVQVTP